MQRLDNYIFFFFFDTWRYIPANLVASNLLQLRPQTDTDGNHEQGPNKGPITPKCNHCCRTYLKRVKANRLFSLPPSASFFFFSLRSPCRWGYIHYLHLSTLPCVDSSLLWLVQTEKVKGSSRHSNKGRNAAALSGKQRVSEAQGYVRKIQQG